MPQLRVLLSEDNQSVHELAEELVTIGRLADNSIQIEDGSVSSHHAEIVVEGGAYRLRDKGSTNGTLVNGQPVTEVVLKDGDRICFGSVDVVFASNAVSEGSALPLPESERVSVRLGSGSARPANFVSSSPFPKPKPKADPLSLAAMALAALGAVAALVSVVLSLGLKSGV